MNSSDYIDKDIIHVTIPIDVDIINKLYKAYSTSNNRKTKVIRIRRIIDNYTGKNQYSNYVPVIFGSNHERTILQIISN